MGNWIEDLQWKVNNADGNDVVGGGCPNCGRRKWYAAKHPNTGTHFYGDNFCVMAVFRCEDCGLVFEISYLPSTVNFVVFNPPNKHDGEGI